MDIYLKNHNGYLRFHYSSKYASGSIPINNIEDLISAIEDTCGKGSYCLYTDKGESYPKTVTLATYKICEGKWPTITSWQQGVKTGVIEQCRDVAKEVWENIPELEIGWLENRLRSYVEDIEDIF